MRAYIHASTSINRRAYPRVWERRFFVLLCCFWQFSCSKLYRQTRRLELASGVKSRLIGAALATLSYQPLHEDCDQLMGNRLRQ